MEAEGTGLFDGQKLILKETDRALTPFGGMVVFLEFLNKIGFVKKLIEYMPVTHRSPNSIPPAQTYVAFLIWVAAGARRSRERLAQRAGGYSLDLDSTVFERHGQQQEGAKKGYNPGGLSHHPLLAVLAESHFVMVSGLPVGACFAVMHSWLRSGNTGTARGVTEFLKEALALWVARAPLRVVRADAGFFD
jgi:hypothetical protein